MTFEHSNSKPEYITEDWDGQYTVLSWLAYVAAIPHVIFMVTTYKENKMPNACLWGWSCFSGEGDHFYVIMPGLRTDRHTYQNIKRTGEFCINFLPPQYAEQCDKTISSNDDDTDEFAVGGFTQESAHAINAPRIKESFLKLECQYEWEKELTPNSCCRTICGKVKHISINDEFGRSTVYERYGNNSFMVHLMGMKDPYTGKRLPGGVGRVELTKEMDL